MAVALFPTCLVDAVAVDVGVASVKLLRRMGHAVAVPPAATCCGQPAWNAGHVEPAAAVAAATLDGLAAAEEEWVVVPSGSCATMIRKFWPELFALVGDHDRAAAAEHLAPRVRELSEFVAESGGLPPAAGSASGPAGRVVYHHSCHMLRELGIEREPESIVAACGAAMAESSARGRCCGFGGLFSMKLPEASTAMADDVLDGAMAAGAESVVGADFSCLMHLRGRAEHRGLPLRFEHLAELAERSTR